MAQFEQERHVELVSGASEAFVVTSRMVSASIPTELPHVSVFVLTINDVDDPKQDVLARVARLSDLTLLPIGRDAGIATPSADGLQYLSASSINSYDTLETANDAAGVLQDRVNALVEAWIEFRTTFNAPDPTPAVYTFPRTDASQKTALIQAYKTAKQDRYQKQLTKTEADAALSRASTQYTYRQSLVSGASGMSTMATVNQSQMASLSAGISALIVSGTTFFVAAAGTPPSGAEKTAFQAALTTATQVQSASVGYISDAASLAATVAAFHSARTTDAATANTALTAAQSDATTKAQLLLSAQTTESAALAAVLAVCPDFDKHSIPFVDDNEP